MRQRVLDMNRREFVSAAGATLIGSAFGSGRLLGEAPHVAAGGRITWRRREASRLFDLVTVGGQPLLDPQDRAGLFDGYALLVENGKLGVEVALDCGKPEGQCGLVRLSLAHALRRSSGDSVEDLLEATLTLRNHSDQPCEVLAGFLTGVRPCRNVADQQVDVPLSAAGLRDPEDDQRKRLKDCRQAVGPEGFLCHYLEPQASDPRNTTTRATLLAPVVDVFADAGPCRVALFGVSVEPVFFEALQGGSSRAWRMGRRVRLKPGESQVVRAFLLLHGGEATEAWRVFREFGHKEDFPAIAWPRTVRVHYFDFLSAAEANGKRGDGYGLTRLPLDVKAQMLHDIASLAKD